MKTMKQCVIFDLDGTLVHSLPDIAAAMNRSLTKFGLPVFEESAYKYKVGNGVLKLTDIIKIITAHLWLKKEKWVKNLAAQPTQ